MGWSCNAAAGLTLDAISAWSATINSSSNAMPGGGFWETSRKEHVDGAITGTVWRLLNAAERARWAHLPGVKERIARAGSFRIDGNGKIVNFPGIPTRLKRAFEATGALEYERRYGKTAA